MCTVSLARRSAHEGAKVFISPVAAHTRPSSRVFPALSPCWCRASSLVALQV